MGKECKLKLDACEQSQTAVWVLYGEEDYLFDVFVHGTCIERCVRAVKLAKSGESFCSEDYMAKSPEWSIFGKGIPGDGTCIVSEMCLS